MHVASETPVSPAARLLRSLPHRWPTLAGLAFAAFSGLNMGDARDEGMVVFLAALVYLATAVIGKPGVVWTLFCMSVVGVTALRLFDLDVWPALVASAVTLAALGLVNGMLGEPGLRAGQLPAMLVFGGAALAGLALPPVLGGCLVAAALIGHVVLDVIVWRADKVVTRSLAEFCAVLDLTLGVTILLVVLT
ncbi:hypothetical protein [Nonomuraea harbinensis]|uniref:Uncharacterized protein n=1 Tax=Nonomuraea harbinensis TaxID=1286938 RepID=A0ABW1C8X6_9ACTN|nr:hypothetical protein [Nonomuraea harbinensis]